MSIEYHVVNRKTNEHKIYTTAKGAAIFMLGKYIKNWFIIKSITGKDKIYDMYSWNGLISDLEKELEQL